MSAMADVLRKELAKGGYQMPGDKLPYETQAANIAAMLTAAGFGLVAEAKAQALDDAAEAIDGETADSLYATRRKELSGPYSKPMLPEQLGELDGIESAATFIRTRAAAERNPG